MTKGRDCKRMSILGSLGFRSLFDGVDALLGQFGVLRIRIPQVGLVVVRQGAQPAFLLLVITRDLETAARLLGLERALQPLGFSRARITRIQRDEVVERRDGLPGNALIVFGLFCLLVVGIPGLIDRFRGDFLVVAVTVGGRFMGLDR